jgi:Rrf2 family transcriptional regulator, iron-sulfur cluster assembly transcription factor
MKFTTKTEYGLVCLMRMAADYGKRDIFTVKEMVDQERYPMAYVEKIFQSLRQAKIVVSRQGKQGGYSIARHPSQITLKQIVEALEGSTFEIFCEPSTRKHIVCNHFCLCGVKPIWKNTKKILDDYLHSQTLEMIAQTIHLNFNESLKVTAGGGKAS